MGSRRRRLTHHLTTEPWHPLDPRRGVGHGLSGTCCDFTRAGRAGRRGGTGGQPNVHVALCGAPPPNVALMGEEPAITYGYHEDPAVVFLHRTIGGYITVFSELTALMRHQILAYLSPTEQAHGAHNRLYDVLFAAMTAKPIVDAFFAMSTEVGQFDEADVAIRNQLKRAVNDHVAFRNDVAHAEWAIGWKVADTGEPVPPVAMRIKSTNGVPTLTNVDITAARIAQQINDLNSLRRLVMVFGIACEGRQQGSDRRVSDVLTAGTADSGNVPSERPV